MDLPQVKSMRYGKLGATQENVLSMTVGQGMKLFAAGAAIGLVGALALARVMRSLIFEVSTTDAATYVIVVVVLGAMSLLACYIPGRRAMRVDPMTALRH